MARDDVLLVFTLVVLMLALPGTVVLVVSVYRGRWAIQAMVRAAKSQPAPRDREFPRRFPRLIGGSHLLFAAITLVGGVGWAVWAASGSRDHPWFELGFASWILAHVPGLFREGILMAKGHMREHRMRRFNFFVLGIGKVVTASLFGISAWMGEARLSVILCAVFALWGILDLVVAWWKAIDLGIDDGPGKNGA